MPGQSGVVLDMRGPQVRLHSSMQGVLSAEQAAPPPPEPTVLPELSHNLRMLLDVTELDLGKRQRKLRLERDALEQLLERRDRHDAAVRQGQAQLLRLEAVREAVHGCVAAAKEAAKKTNAAAIAAASGVDDGGGGVGDGGGDGGGGGDGENGAADDERDAPLIELAKKWALLRQAYPDEYAQWQLGQTAATLVLPPLKRSLARWRALRAPRRGTALLAAWQRALCPRGAGAPPPPPGGEAAYGALVYAAVLPALRTALANEWQVFESDAATELLETWRALLPEVRHDETQPQPQPQPQPVAPLPPLPLAPPPSPPPNPPLARARCSTARWWRRRCCRASPRRSHATCRAPTRRRTRGCTRGCRCCRRPGSRRSSRRSAISSPPQWPRRRPPRPTPPRAPWWRRGGACLTRARGRRCCSGTC